MKKYNVTVNGEKFSVEVEELGGVPTFTAPAPAPVAAAPAPAPAAAPAPVPVAAPTPASAPATAPVSAPTPGANVVASPLPGTILRVNVAVGQAVKVGEVLLVLEAMKMENDITAPHNGVVSALHVSAHDTVQTGDALVSL